MTCCVVQDTKHCKPITQGEDKNRTHMTRDRALSQHECQTRHTNAQLAEIHVLWKTVQFGDARPKRNKKDESRKGRRPHTWHQEQDTLHDSEWSQNIKNYEKKTRSTCQNSSATRVPGNTRKTQQLAQMYDWWKTLQLQRCYDIKRNNPDWNSTKNDAHKYGQYE